MKKTIFFALLTIFSLSASSVFATKTNSTNTTVAPAATENKLSEEEISTLTSRVKEIRDMDKSNLSASEKSELKSELKEIKETIKSDPYIYIGGSTLLILIIVLIILL
ncbi:MAG: hypothetical protein LLF95_08735 [Bacteroidales bacterium]|jgi:CRISPR/Cas system CSM-associated protein Csm5 (group 7 of RAMP superfamily)|nr:hypothetical protein [Bacteroidales bacterium]